MTAKLDYHYVQRLAIAIIARAVKDASSRAVANSVEDDCKVTVRDRNSARAWLLSDGAGMAEAAGLGMTQDDLTAWVGAGCPRRWK